MLDILFQKQHWKDLTIKYVKVKPRVKCPKSGCSSSESSSSDDSDCYRNYYSTRHKQHKGSHSANGRNNSCFDSSSGDSDCAPKCKGNSRGRNENKT